MGDPRTEAVRARGYPSPTGRIIVAATNPFGSLLLDPPGRARGRAIGAAVKGRSAEKTEGLPTALASSCPRASRPVGAAPLILTRALTSLAGSEGQKKRLCEDGSPWRGSTSAENGQAPQGTLLCPAETALLTIPPRRPGPTDRSEDTDRAPGQRMRASRSHKIYLWHDSEALLADIKTLLRMEQWAQ